MGRNMPGDNHDALEWLEGHIAQWVADPAAIGIASAVVLDLATQIVNTRASFVSVEQARSDSKVATSNFHSAGDTLRANASGIISNIKNFAENSADPDVVYTAAGITPADPPSPVAPPVQPTDVKATLNPDGSVTLSWAGRGPVGTVYNVSRKLATETSFSLVGQGDARDKDFTDATIPSGTASATYIVQGVRGSSVGAQSTAAVVTFGGTEGGSEGLNLAA